MLATLLQQKETELDWKDRELALKSLLLDGGEATRDEVQFVSLCLSSLRSNLVLSACRVMARMRVVGEGELISSSLLSLLHALMRITTQGKRLYVKQAHSTLADFAGENLSCSGDMLAWACAQFPQHHNPQARLFTVRVLVECLPHAREESHADIEAVLVLANGDAN